jgi:hypothetical protein
MAIASSLAVVVLALVSAWSAADDPTALLINGEPISKTDFAAVAADMRGAIAPISGSIPSSLRPLPPVVEAVEYLVVVQVARQSGFAMNDERIEQLFANMRERRGLANDEQLAAALKRESASLDAIRRGFERRVAFERLRLDVLNRSHVGEEEARKYYDSHRAEFALSSFEQAKDQIVHSLSTPERQAQAWDAYVKSLCAQAVVEWRDDRLRRVYELAIGLQ